MIGLEARQKRRAFTLTELLIVMTIISIIAALGYMFFPSFSNRTMVDAADRLQGWLLIAKQQARRDNRQTGLRLVVGTSPYVTTLQYIQQPDDFVGPAGSVCSCTGNTTVNFPSPPSTSLLGNGTINDANTADDIASVQAGDYLEFNSSGLVYPIASLTAANALTLSLSGPSTSNNVPYRILRQPRRILGEEDLIMPGNTAEQTSIDPNSGTVIDTSSGKSLNLPSPPRTISGLTCYEIVFSPSGSVVGPAAAHDMICLWVRTEKDTAPAVLVTIRTRTGAIGVYDVDPSGADPYAFARNGRSSGM